MKFLTWILLVAYFALTDSAPTTEQPSNTLNHTNEINIAIAQFLDGKIPNTNISEKDYQKEFYNHTINGILYNVTLNNEKLVSVKFDLPSHENDSFKVSGQLPTMFLEGYARDSDQYFVTDKIKLNYIVILTPQNEVHEDYSNFNLDKIHLHVGNNYQYKPNEEIQIKKEIQTQIMKRLYLYKFSEKENKTEAMLFAKGVMLLLLENNTLAHNKQERYYLIGTISSTNYTLNNVTINGLWNVISMSKNPFNLSAYEEIEISGVTGSMVQNFPSKSEDLSFKADKIYFSVDRNISKVNVKVQAHSVWNNKLNVSLPEDQSKLIISEIESAFAASLQKVWEKQ